MPSFEINSLIVIEFFIAFYLVFRTSIASPLAIFALFNPILDIYLYYTQTPGFNPSEFYAVLPYNGLEQFVLPVVMFHTMLNVAALSTALTIRQSKRSSFRTSVAQLRRLMSSKVIITYLSLVTIITVVHVATFDLSYLWSYTGYHAINDPDLVGIDNPVALFYHRTGPMLAAVCWAISVVCLHTKRPFIGGYAIVLGLYGFVLIAASSSRELAQFFVLPTIVHYFFTRRVGAGFIIGCVLAAFSILFAISSRGHYAELGIGNLFANVGDMSFDGVTGVFEALFSNVAQGGLAMANALRINPSYPLSYINVSMFSPFPNSIDNYTAISSQYQVKITHASPIGALAEVYLFGWQYTIVFVAALMLALRAATKKLNGGSSILTVPILGLTIIMIYLAHHYPTRHSNRIMLMLILFYGVDYVLTKRKRVKRVRSAPPAELPSRFEQGA